MEAKKSKKESPTPEAPRGPVKVLRIDDVSASIFARERQLQGSLVTFYSVSFSRSYKDATGLRKYTKNFDADDLGTLAALIQQASEFIHGQRSEQAA